MHNFFVLLKEISHGAGKYRSIWYDKDIKFKRTTNVIDSDQNEDKTDNFKDMNFKYAPKYVN